MSMSTSLSETEVVDVTRSGVSGAEDDAGIRGGESPSGRIRLALVNDYELVLRGVEALLTPFNDRVEVVEVDVRRQPTQPVDIALFDPYGHHHLGLDEVGALAQNSNVGAVAVYTWQLMSGQADKILAAGAKAVLAKSIPADDLIAKLEQVAQGETVVSREFRLNTSMSWPGADLRLTERESEVVTFLASGMSNRDIADALILSENTVKTHLKSIFHKIGVSSRAQAVARIVTDPAFQRVSRPYGGSDRSVWSPLAQGK
jgi:DNA-binding NarL/FixJ family response regulator